jgi:hypothetical protein
MRYMGKRELAIVSKRRLTTNLETKEPFKYAERCQQQVEGERQLWHTYMQAGAGRKRGERGSRTCSWGAWAAALREGWERV